MGLTDQKPRIATEGDVKAPWSGGKNGKYFRCKLCGHKFEVGDYYRFIFHNYGNIMVCQSCDKDNPAEKWTQLHDEWDKLRAGKFWWFIVRNEDELKSVESEFAHEARDLQEEKDHWKSKALYGGSDRMYG